jgi:hypothetical protein
MYVLDRFDDVEYAEGTEGTTGAAMIGTAGLESRLITVGGARGVVREGEVLLKVALLKVTTSFFSLGSTNDLID